MAAMLPKTPADLLLLRARALAAAGHSWEALALYERAVDEAARGPERIGAAEESLDFCINAFGKEASETLAAAERLGQVDPDGAGASHCAWLLGNAGSQRVRRIARDSLTDALQQGDLVRATLRDAVALAEEHGTNVADAWGTLGGLLSRMADWADELGQDRAATLRAEAVDAYRRGCLQAPDPYCLLNWIVERAIHETPAAGDLVPSEHRDAFDRAVRVRRNQFAAGQDRPWPAFDLALARWLTSNDGRLLLEDLGYAVRDARESARSADESWKVSTALRVYRRLDHANRRAGAHWKGLDLAIAFLENQLVERRWFALSLPPIVRPDDLLRTELANLSRAIKTDDEATRLLIEGAIEDLSETLDATRDRLEERWHEEDEAAFDQWIEDHRSEWEAKDVKFARAAFALIKGIGGKAGDISLENMDWGALLQGD